VLEEFISVEKTDAFTNMI